jgi:tripartite ATP-independent transporter DctM subunit
MAKTDRSFIEHAGQIVDHISWAAILLAGVLMLAVAAFMSFEAFSRHFLDQPTSWVLAISILIFMWFIFLATPYGIKADKHVACDVFVSQMPEPTQLTLGIATDLVSLAYILALGVYGYGAYEEAVAMGSMSEGLVRYPMWLVLVTMPLGMGLSLLQMLRKIQVRLARLRELTLIGTKPHRFGPLTALSWFIVSLTGGVLVFLYSQPLGILILALVLLFWGTPISFALGAVGMTGLIFFHEGLSGLNTLPIVAEHTGTNFVLLAIPLFTLGGLILSRSGLGEEMYEMSSRWLGWIPGGLGVATCITGGVLAAMIGSSTAVTAIVTLVAMKPLLDRGYNKTLVIGTVTGSSLGLIIPPSIGFIVYGFLTDTSVGELFMAGVVPGAMLVLLFSSYVIIVCKITGKYQVVSYTWKERLASLRTSVIVLFGPVFVLGSIYTGLSTPTEAGAILVLYSLFCALVFRKINFKGFIQCLIDSSMLSTMILMIMVGALAMSNVITLLQVPSRLTEFIVSSGLPTELILLLIMLFYVILGMFLDGGSITVLTVPVIAPMLPSLGIDVVVFGVILMMLIETALLTPPVGLNIFTVRGILDEPLSLIIKSVLPFVLILIVSVILIFLIPEIALWLPAKMR